MGGDCRGLAAQPQPIDGHAQPQQSEQQEVVKPQVVYHLVPLHARQVNGGIAPMCQARELSAGWRYMTASRDPSGGMPPRFLHGFLFALETDRYKVSKYRFPFPTFYH